MVVNNSCRVHYDSHNIKESLTFHVGDFTGGQLCTIDEKNGEIVKHDLRNNKYLIFDGSRTAHFVLPF